MNKGNNAAGKSDKLTTLAVIIAIIVVLALAVYATYGKISKNIVDNKIASGEMAETVSHAAEAAGMSVEDYLATYSLTVSDEVNGDTAINDLYGYMTLENYMNMANEGNEEPVDIDSVINEWGLEGKVTKDTQWKDVEPLMPLSARFSEEQIAQYKESYGLGDEVDGNTTYGDFQKLIEAKLTDLMSATASPSADGADTPAE